MMTPTIHPYITNGAQEKLRITEDGGVAIRLVNKTGAASVKGTVVQLATTPVDSGFVTVAADFEGPVGVVYQDGVPDGENCLVVVMGVAKTLVQDGHAPTRGYWAGVSSAPGRITTLSAIPGTPTHNREIGHVLESKSAGTNVLVRVSLHFN